jgi:hypothetical protein
MQIAVERGRQTRPELKLGICGEHGGDPVSIHFCHQIGIDYVSCSGPRVPIARLAAAQAKLLEKQYQRPSWMPGDADPDKVSEVESDNDEGVEQGEADSWDNEQIHRGDIGGMIGEKGASMVLEDARTA